MASDWSDPIWQIGPAWAPLRRWWGEKLPQSSFNFYKTLSFSFSIWFYPAKYFVRSACDHQWSMSQSFYLSRLQSLNLMRVCVWYFSHNIDISLLTQVITQQTWPSVSVMSNSWCMWPSGCVFKPQLNLLEKVRCVWNQILIDAFKASRPIASHNPLMHYNLLIISSQCQD